MAISASDEMDAVLAIAVDACLMCERILSKEAGELSEPPSAISDEYDEFLRSPVCTEIIQHWCETSGIRTNRGLYSLDKEIRTETHDVFYEIWRHTRSLFFVLRLVRGGSYDVVRINKQLDNFEKYNSLREEADQHLTQAARLKALPHDYYRELEREHLARQPKTKVGGLSVPTLDVERNYKYPPAIHPRKILGNCIDHIPNRGRAANPDSATRTLVTRRLSSMISDTLPDRFAAIAELMKSSGIDTNAHIVRAALSTERNP